MSIGKIKIAKKCFSDYSIGMNYYDVFGLPPTASIEDINAAHKALAKKYHPDINSSKDAHEKMTILNQANEVLSDSTRRKEYDKELNINREKLQERKASSSSNGNAKGAYDTQASEVSSKRSHDTKFTQERSSKAELLRKKAEAKMKTREAVQAQRMEHEQRRTQDASQRSKQVRVDVDKQHVLNVLSDLVMDGNKQRGNKKEVDEERLYATKVLLSMVRSDNEHLRRRAEEADHKQRIEEILALVKEYNSDGDNKKTTP